MYGIFGGLLCMHVFRGRKGGSDRESYIVDGE